MKKVTALIMLLGVAANVFSQQIRPAKKQLSSQEYLSKSSDQLVIGSILLAGGTSLIFVGSNQAKNATGFDFTGIFVEALGVITVGGSIPVFISAIYNHNKGKGIAINIKPENAFTIQKCKMQGHSYPALSVKISL